jgi:hypothetical protein|tara:strand:- start:2720 stop:2962 length:243 start_codon:yes stop_codon:yes gene_type:complete
MIRLTIHENNTGTIDFQTEEDLREWIKDPEMKEVEWDYSDYEVFNKTFFIEERVGTANPRMEDISNFVYDTHSDQYQGLN